jgi:hypothetical protein
MTLLSIRASTSMRTSGFWNLLGGLFGERTNLGSTLATQISKMILNQKTPLSDASSGVS